MALMMCALTARALGPDAKDAVRSCSPVLEYTGGNQRRAALLLGIARRTLRQKLRDLGLHVAHSVEADEDDLP